MTCSPSAVAVAVNSATVDDALRSWIMVTVLLVATMIAMGWIFERSAAEMIDLARRFGVAVGCFVRLT